MSRPWRNSARVLMATAGVLTAVTAGTGVGSAIPGFYPPTPGDPPPPIVIVFPPISSFPIVVTPGSANTIYSPQLPAGIARPIISPGMYPVQSPTGADPIATSGISNWEPIRLAGTFALTLAAGAYAARRRQLATA
ncbi:hypothetical protein [Smaragdicoccus niigatensis]|uniref:hypothetical protein n=1 Tax=Smaragdicoccus niigatensis TaxID=359359 RepID=UPI0003A21489|nr:hypothetical protein [Smaragdicoccus niigatensis]